MAILSEDPGFSALDESTKSHVTALGFDKLDALTAVSQAASKLAALGPNPDDLIRLPKDATGDALAPLYDRLGVPKDAAGYTFPDGSPEDLTAQVRREAAALKLTPAAAQQLLASRQAAAAEAKQRADEAHLAAITAAKGELQVGWGSEAALKEFRASKALETFGWTPADVERMASGSREAYVKIMQNMAVLGDRMAEARLLGGSTGSGENTSYTPQQAEAKIAALKADPNWAAKWRKGLLDPEGKQANEELANLQRIVVQGRFAA